MKETLARQVLVVAAGLAAAWGMLILATPWLATERTAAPRYLAAVAYLTGGTVCHQRADRSFHIDGIRLPVCARCTGLYVAAPFGLVLALSRRRPTLGGLRRRFVTGAGERRATARLVLTVAALPTVATVFAEWMNVWSPGGSVRALAAAPLGVAVAWILGKAGTGHLR